MAKANFFLMIASIAAAASVAIWVFQTTGWVKALGKAEQ
jgi:hypothetical protein